MLLKADAKLINSLAGNGCVIVAGKKNERNAAEPSLPLARRIAVTLPGFSGLARPPPSLLAGDNACDSLSNEFDIAFGHLEYQQFGIAFDTHRFKHFHFLGLALSLGDLYLVFPLPLQLDVCVFRYLEFQDDIFFRHQYQP
jgi:hypothetical protein